MVVTVVKVNSDHKIRLLKIQQSLEVQHEEIAKAMAQVEQSALEKNMALVFYETHMKQMLEDWKHNENVIVEMVRGNTNLKFKHREGCLPYGTIMSADDYCKCNDSDICKKYDA